MAPSLAVRLTAACVLVCAAGTAPAQSPWPSKPIRIIAPLSPGSAPDTRMRQIAPKLAELLGQPVFVENRPGANSALGAREAGRAAPDGYTLFNGNINNAINDALKPEPGTRLVTDFRAITDIASSPLVMVVHASVPAANLQEFIALARAKPGSLTYSSSSTGSINQLVGERFKMAAGIDVREVPYKATGADLPDLVAGHVNAGFAVHVTFQPHIASGKLRPIAVASTTRISSLPEVPTYAEAGLGPIEAMTWNGLFVPVGTPDAIVQTLYTATVKVLNHPDVQSQIIQSGSAVGGRPSAEFGGWLDREIATWAKVVRDTGVKFQ